MKENIMFVAKFVIIHVWNYLDYIHNIKKVCYYEHQDAL